MNLSRSSNRNIKILDLLKISFLMLDRKDKYTLFFLSIGSFVGSLFELVSLTSVLPFVSLLLNNELIEANSYLNFVWETFNKPTYRQFVLISALIIAFLLIISTAFVYFVQFLSNKFAAKCQ